MEENVDPKEIYKTSIKPIRFTWNDKSQQCEDWTDFYVQCMQNALDDGLRPEELVGGYKLSQLRKRMRSLVFRENGTEKVIYISINFGAVALKERFAKILGKITPTPKVKAFLRDGTTEDFFPAPKKSFQISSKPTSFTWNGQSQQCEKWCDLYVLCMQNALNEGLKLNDLPGKWTLNQQEANFANTGEIKFRENGSETIVYIDKNVVYKSCKSRIISTLDKMNPRPQVTIFLENGTSEDLIPKKIQTIVPVSLIWNGQRQECEGWNNLLIRCMQNALDSGLKPQRLGTQNTFSQQEAKNYYAVGKVIFKDGGSEKIIYVNTYGSGETIKNSIITTLDKINPRPHVEVLLNDGTSEELIFSNGKRSILLKPINLIWNGQSQECQMWSEVFVLCMQKFLDSGLTLMDLPVRYTLKREEANYYRIGELTFKENESETTIYIDKETGRSKCETKITLMLNKLNPRPKVTVLMEDDTIVEL